MESMNQLQKKNLEELTLTQQKLSILSKQYNILIYLTTAVIVGTIFFKLKWS